MTDLPDRRARTAHRLAIYDLDRTITRRPTWTPFLIAAVRARAPWRWTLAPVVIGAALLNQLGAIDRRSLKQVMHRAALGTLTDVEATALAEAFADDFGARHIYPAARARIAADRAAGFTIVIATAAYDFYAEALARAVGADALVATRATRGAKGRILPQVAGDNCYGPAKLAMIKAWMREQGIAREQALVRFYSDHRSDAPTFAWADEPFAVNPHKPLRQLAAAQGWPVLEWQE
ncbi:HAD-IB family hydrolase [Sphingomonas sp. GC_Shp_1]|uniref:HAD family hydrolase n=1 Tax=unclassified Sphingomonas TaxID=196159 RepID=UPI00226A8302